MVCRPPPGFARHEERAPAPARSHGGQRRGTAGERTPEALACLAYLHVTVCVCDRVCVYIYMQEELDALLTELQGYKQASQSSQQHITRLETKNASLRAEVRQHLSAQQQQQPAGTGAGAGAALLLPPPPSANHPNHSLQAPHTALSGKCKWMEPHT